MAIFSSLNEIGVGLGWWLFMAAALLKIVDVFCHAIVPVPQDIEQQAHVNLKLGFAKGAPTSAEMNSLA